MTVQTDLLALERQFWNGDADFYRNNLDDKCLVTFAEMSGVMSREEVSSMVKNDPPRWTDLAFQEKGCLEPVSGLALLSYEATGKRATGEPYSANVSSGYVRRDGAWKLAFHQQTPRKTN